MEKQSKICAFCGNVFYKKSSTSQKEWSNITKFCSHKCHSAAQEKDHERVCHFCGKTYIPKFLNCQAHSKFCSLECSSKSQKKPLPICEICGKTCKKHRSRFCSPECKIIWYRGDKVYCYIGENFRKNAYPVDYAFWGDLAKEIRERDKVCRHCGKTPIQNGRALDIHHIIPYRISKDNSPSNLIALCRVCHKTADAAIRTKEIAELR